MEYEICYLIGESKELDLDSIKKNVEEIVTKEGGVFLDGEFQEKRKMAYEIKKEIRGTYVARRFSVDDKDKKEEKEYPGKDVVSEITKKMNLNNDVLRFIVVKTDDLPELRKSDAEAQQKKEASRKLEAREVKREVAVKKKEEKKEEKEELETKDESQKSKKETQGKEEKKESKESVKSEEKKESETKDESQKSKKEDQDKDDKKKEEKKSEESAEDFDKKLDEIIKI